MDVFMLASPLTLFFIPAIMFHKFPEAGHIDLWTHFEEVRAWIFTLAAIHVSLCGEDGQVSCPPAATPLSHAVRAKRA